MSTFVIGDIHGCFDALAVLLDQLPFKSRRDRLWLVGDLVNRGPDSLEVLRWAHDTSQAMGERFAAVLGNHDIHLLARAAGIESEKRGDTLDEVLEAPDSEVLLDWLRTLPLIHQDTVGKRDFGMVHAGLAPHWSWSEALDRARKLGRKLAHDHRLLSRRAAPAEPTKISELRDSLHYFTRVRMCDRRGRRVAYNGPPSGAPAGTTPWFDHPLLLEESERPTLIFGHWAALGLHRGTREIGLDSGCVWGGALTALRLDDKSLFQVEVQ